MLSLYIMLLYAFYLDQDCMVVLVFGYPLVVPFMVRILIANAKPRKTMQNIKSLEEVLNTPQKKLAFYQNLILVAAADQVLDQDESDLLLFIGDRLGLTPDDVMPIADNLNVLSFIIPEEGLQKTLELQTLVQMMMQDGQVHDREYSLCLEYASRIGYGKTILDDMIKQFASENM
jgi:uncharacterized tellurite resistance protein B-like protein